MSILAYNYHGTAAPPPQRNIHVASSQFFSLDGISTMSVYSTFPHYLRCYTAAASRKSLKQFWVTKTVVHLVEYTVQCQQSALATAVYLQ